MREAIDEHAKRIDRLSDAERDRMLRVLEKLRSEPPTRSDAERRAELREIRLSRRAAGIHRSRRSTRAAAIYRALPSPRGREIDIAIAACAIEHDAALWTRNPADFRDIPALKLYKPPKG